MDSLATGSLLNALLECFKKLNIDFWEEVTIDGEDGYQKIIKSDVATVWETFFCSAMVKLSRAPRCDTASPNPDALRAWRRGEVNDKTISTLRNKYIPSISVSNGYTYIDAQKEHIIYFLELAVCAGESVLDKDKNSENNEKYLYKKNLVERKSILPYIYSKFAVLKELFEDIPIHIIANRDDIKWFSDIVANRIPEIDNDENERKFAAVFAAAMILSLNIKDEKKIPIEESTSVDERIKEYLYKLFGNVPKASEESQKTASPTSKELYISIPRISKSNDDAEAKKSELSGAFDSLKFAKNEYGIWESISRIKRAIAKCFHSAEDLIRILSDDEDSEEVSRNWIDCAYRLKDMITEMVAYYRVVLERDLLTQDSHDQELTSFKLDFLDTSVEVYIIFCFLEAQLKKEFEELNRSACITEKEQIRFRIMKTQMDLKVIRREYESTDKDIDSIVERKVMSNYDMGTI